MDHHHPHRHLLSLDSGKISFAIVFILSSVDTVRIKRLGRVVQRTFHRTSIRIKMSMAKVFSPHKVTDTISNWKRQLWAHSYSNANTGLSTLWMWENSWSGLACRVTDSELCILSIADKENLLTEINAMESRTNGPCCHHWRWPKTPREYEGRYGRNCVATETGSSLGNFK